MRNPVVPVESVSDRLRRWASEMPDTVTLDVYAHEISDVVDFMARSLEKSRAETETLLRAGRLNLRGHQMLVKE